MIDHETARRSFATSLDFALEPAEGEALDAHLAGCPSCRAFSTSLRSDAATIRDLDTGPVPITVRANVAIAAEHGRRSNPVGRWVGIAVFAALLLGVLGAGALGVGGRGGSGVPGPSAAVDAAATTNQIEWKTNVVALTAREFAIEVGGKTFQATTPTVDVHSDPGDATYRTLEATWKENGVEMRMNLYWAGDATASWVNEVRIYDGKVAGDWLTAAGTYFKTPVGGAWTGDQDIAFTDPSGLPARLHFGGLHAHHQVVRRRERAARRRDRAAGQRTTVCRRGRAPLQRDPPDGSEAGRGDPPQARLPPQLAPGHDDRAEYGVRLGDAGRPGRGHQLGRVGWFWWRTDHVRGAIRRPGRKLSRSRPTARRPTRTRPLRRPSPSRPSRRVTKSRSDGTPIQVTGHFDDPRAKTCRGDGQSAKAAVASCRRQFVVTSYKRIDQP